MLLMIFILLVTHQQLRLYLLSEDGASGSVSLYFGPANIYDLYQAGVANTISIEDFPGQIT